MISIENLKKQFGENLACNIDRLDIQDGEILGIVGNNGAGKTTLFRIMLDLLKADEGSVAIDGVNPASSEQWKDFLAAYIDDGFLIDYLTPDEFFTFVGKITDIPSDLLKERLQEMEKFASGELFGQKKTIRNLSAGNKQKAGIIAAMLRRPRILILDEPFNFLDPSSQTALKQMLLDYNRQTGATVIVSSHNLQHTIDISTRIVLLEKGRVISDLNNEERQAAEQLADYFGL